MKAIIEKLRDFIKAEVAAGIAGERQGEDGYYGNNHEESKQADKIYGELLHLSENIALISITKSRQK